MQTFLDLVANSLYTKYGNNISQCCLVFPGRRARLFFNKALAEQLEQTIWQPTSMGISQLVEQLTGRKADDPLLLISELYNSYKKIVANPKEFDEFYTLGKLILQDFDTIDKYRVDHRRLYRNIKEYKDIEQNYDFLSTQQIECVRSFWESFNRHPDHHLNQSFMALWSLLPVIYDHFNNALTLKGIAYEGALYRQMADNLHSDESHTFFNQYTSFVFIGFNALNPCEKALFSALRNMKKALFYWDYDVHYVNDPDQLQEAGLFMRENLRNFPPELTFTDKDSGLHRHKSLEVLPVPSYVLQAKVVPQLIREKKLTYNTNTAIVLADEELLLPLLHALAPDDNSDQKGTLNVTMGFPFKQTLLFSLFEETATRNIKTLKNHPYVATLNLFDALNHNPANYRELVQMLLNAIDSIEEGQDKLPEDKMLGAILREGRKQLNRMVAATESLDTEIGTKMFMRLLLTHLSTIRIPFSGEPLQGMQIIGMLETRCLDFEHLIILSAQENHLPKVYKDHSLIPYNFKKAFGLPSPEQHLAMHAYYFYRLIQRAQTVTFVYNNKTEGPSKGEISRFIRQMNFELPQNPITYSQMTYQLSLPAVKGVCIAKTGQVREKIEEIISQQKYLSVSALKTYLLCPLSFYYNVIMHIKEEDKEDENDSRHFGTLLHSVLEKLYGPYLGKTMTKEDVESLIKDNDTFQKTITTILEDYYYSEFDPQHKTELPGKWLLMQEAISEYVRAFIHNDARRAPFKIIGLEQKCFMQYKQWRFIGFYDRVEERNGKIYICDYKSGRTDITFSDVDNLFNKNIEKQNGNIFQVLFYCFLSQYAQEGTTPIPVLYYMRELFGSGTDGYLLYKKEPLIDIDSVKEAFLNNLDKLLAEITNFDIPFTQAENPKSCTYCPFVPICQRDRVDE